MSRQTVSIIGCGAIGSVLAREISRRFRGRFRVAYLADRLAPRARQLARRLPGRVRVVSNLEALRRANLTIECASQEAARELSRRALASGKHLVVLSVGGLLGIRGFDRLLARAKGRIWVPSGAIGGLDVLRAGRFDSLREVELTTRKPLAALAGAPGLRRKLRGRETVLFDGSAAKAVRLFPKNVNVAALVSFAGLGPRRTRVRVIASSRVRRNCHELTLRGAFGRARMIFENEPSRSNPGTSRLAAFSVLALLERMTAPLAVGS